MTRIFENMKEAIDEIKRDIMEMGIEVKTVTMQNKVIEGNDDFTTLEVQNYSFSILDMTDKDEVCDDLEWCNKEFEERISGKENNPGEAWKLRRSTWAPFLKTDGTMDYTYADRYRYGSGLTQFDNVIQILLEDPGSRQAIIHMHFPDDVEKANEFINPIRIPCSMYYQFLIRRGQLDVIYNMRSSDFDTHFKNDIWLADELKQHIARILTIEPGIFHMNVGSLHRYKNYAAEQEHVF